MSQCHNVCHGKYLFTTSLLLQTPSRLTNWNLRRNLPGRKLQTRDGRSSRPRTASSTRHSMPARFGNIFPSQAMKYFCRKAAMNNDDNSMLQMTALVSAVTIMILILFSKGQSSQPSGYLVPGSPAGQTQFNAILCCTLLSYYLLLFLRLEL